MEIERTEGRFYKIRIPEIEMLYNNTGFHNEIFESIGEYYIINWYKDFAYLGWIYVVEITLRNILFRKFNSDINRKREILFRRF